GNMSRASPLPGFRSSAVKASFRAGIDELLSMLIDDLKHIGFAADHFGIQLRRERFRRDVWRAAFDRASFRLPFGQAAVQNRNLAVTECAEHPPGTGSELQSIAVVNNHAILASYPEFANRICELLG